MKTVIEMAREVYGEHTFWTGPQLERLERFAELVRADEREACAKAADQYMRDCEGKSFGVGNSIRARSSAK